MPKPQPSESSSDPVVTDPAVHAEAASALDTAAEGPTRRVDTLLDARTARICASAHRHAQVRGFAPGHEEIDDWVAAEAEERYAGAAPY